jgi:hypothetical protein
MRKGPEFKSRNAIGFLLGLCLTACAACGDSCRNDVLSETKSPDNKLKVVVFERDCGTLTSFSTQVSIVSAQAAPEGRGNLFVADDNNRAVPVGPRGTIEIKLRWESSSSLLLSYPKKAQVFMKKPEVAGVAVRYEVVP